MFSKLRQLRKPLFLGKNANSIMYVGTDTKIRPIWLDSDTLLHHLFVTGTTGAGKTETLLGMMTNAFAWNSGGVFVDGKGDVALYAKMSGLAEHYGRRDDLYVLNFMSGPADGRNDLPFQSHRYNPFEKGTPDSLVDMLVNIVCADDASRLWAGRATAMLTGIMRVLCWQRDAGGQYLDARVIKNGISLKKIIDFAYSERYRDIPAPCRTAVMSYLQSLPEFDPGKGHAQSQTVLDQHGHLEIQFAKVLGPLIDVYGHIFAAGCSDIDFDDIVKNRRFLVVLMPALEKAKDEIAVLGRVVVAGLQSMLTCALSEKITGNWQDHTRWPAGQKPFLSIFDECAYYLVDKIDLMGAQARSMNMALVFGSQDLRAIFRSGSARTAFEIARTKIVMRSSEWHPEMTLTFERLEAGRDDVMSAARKDAASIFGSPHSLVWGMDEGEFALINSGRLLIGKAAYVAIRSVSQISVARFRPVRKMANKLLVLEEERSTAKTDASECPGLPIALQGLCGPAAAMTAAEGVQMLSSALAALEDGVAINAKDATDEYVRIGE